MLVIVASDGKHTSNDAINSVHFSNATTNISASSDVVVFVDVGRKVLLILVRPSLLMLIEVLLIATSIISADVTAYINNISTVNNLTADAANTGATTNRAERDDDVIIANSITRSITTPYIPNVMMAPI